MLLAALVHTTLVVLGAYARSSELAFAQLRFQPIQLLETDVTIELPLEAGGGSSVAGEADRAEGDAPEPREPAPVAAKVPQPKVERKPDALPEVPPDQVEEVEEPDGAPRVDEERTWSERDVLLAESNESAPFAIRPRSAFKDAVAQGRFVEPLAGTAQPTNGRKLGRGSGVNGGDGGEGAPLGAPIVVAEEFVFGGKEGAFLGRMCFVQENLRSLKALGACPTQLRFRTDRINIPPRRFDQGFPGIPQRDEWFSILYTGTINVSRPGSYAFRVLSDDGSVLHIDGVPVVDNDGLHGPTDARGEVELSEGPHRLELWYFQGPRMLVALQVFVTPPGEGERLLEPSL
jgi:hypothetical protein